VLLCAHHTFVILLLAVSCSRADVVAQETEEPPERLWSDPSEVDAESLEEFLKRMEDLQQKPPAEVPEVVPPITEQAHAEG